MQCFALHRRCYDVDCDVIWGSCGGWNEWMILWTQVSVFCPTNLLDWTYNLKVRVQLHFGSIKSALPALGCIYIMSHYLLQVWLVMCVRVCVRVCVYVCTSTYTYKNHSSYCLQMHNLVSSSLIYFHYDCSAAISFFIYFLFYCCCASWGWKPRRQSSLHTCCSAAILLLALYMSDFD